ncbi:MAG: hypothetical protein LBK08_08365 [Treponema sp.]|jgi:hypothetical protein|nr:hypothetical protein [Treponema sp.]
MTKQDIVRLREIKYTHSNHNRTGIYPYFTKDKKIIMTNGFRKKNAEDAKNRKRIDNKKYE